MLQIHGNNKESSSSSLNVAHDRKGIEQPHAEIMKQQGLDSTQHKARQGKAWHGKERH
uniref:HDC13907 n=1 Tax=Drosophila melanogaster TaxID=7227 RepID=Q6IK01_DROME|nr:TPA_inf: HDC13907 [Drosophila melanogaster]